MPGWNMTGNMEVRTGTVSQINAYIKKILDHNIILNNVNVKGEISNFKRHFSGHIYLTLKDEGGVLKAVMFRGSASKLTFEPTDGMKVIARGRVTVYEAGGSYQLYIEEMRPDGIGSLYEQYEKLKRQLEREGLFDSSYKKPIPKFPKRVGVITAATGAAVRDIINVITRRYPMAEIVLYPAQVQGTGSAQSVVNGIEYFNAKKNVDTIIAGRGGGSIEDLWAFNEEIVARAIFASEIPIISAVGHETDFTIADFVADLRAPTPSAAAEIAVPSSAELHQRLNEINSRLIGAIGNGIRHRRLQLARCRLKTPKQRIEENALRLDAVTKRLESSYTRLLTEKSRRLERLSSAADSGFKLKLSHEQRRFASCVAKLDALSPLAVLTRGYAIPLKDNSVVKSVKQVSTGDRLEIKMHDGAVECEVI